MWHKGNEQRLSHPEHMHKYESNSRPVMFFINIRLDWIITIFFFILSRKRTSEDRKSQWQRAVLPPHELSPAPRYFCGMPFPIHKASFSNPSYHQYSVKTAELEHNFTQTSSASTPDIITKLFIPRQGITLDWFSWPKHPKYTLSP